MIITCKLANTNPELEFHLCLTKSQEHWYASRVLEFLEKTDSLLAFQAVELLSGRGSAHHYFEKLRNYFKKKKKEIKDWNRLIWLCSYPGAK